MAIAAFLQQATSELVQAVLMAGTAWMGMGWDTTKAAKAVRALTGLAMVSTRFQDYLTTFLLSISLSAGLEIPALELSDRALDVAFSFSERWQSASTTPGALKR